MEGEEKIWIEAPDAWGPCTNEEDQDDDGGGAFDLFGEQDPRDSFTFTVKPGKCSSKVLILDGFRLDSGETAHSTGVTLWQAAPRLADYLQEHAGALCKGKLVLELGAGLGLCGITAYHLGAKITMTDGDTNVLVKMRENVRQNCGDGDGAATADGSSKIECRQLLWGSPHMEQFSTLRKFDTILGADVIYTEASLRPLFETVAYFLGKASGQFVLSRYNKWNNVHDEVVIEAANECGLQCTQPSQGIFVFTWKRTAVSGA